ncbi:MAG TPA: uracil-DNA glycosylase family protein [Chitinophagaceae bacterium]|nr:uracil-DNA glycosylase family protein [Chitinophagaceae bacterium]
MSLFLSTDILSFLKNLDLNLPLPQHVAVMNPFKEKSTFAICKKFYEKYYSDNNTRFLILGINPGRFGGGVTGIPFTDPVRLNDICGIENTFSKKQELSSVFIYEMIRAFGGAEEFYNQFYISSVSPLGFTRHNKNMNYYDDKQLQESLKDFAVDCIKRQVKFGLRKEVAFCFGEGKNYVYLEKLNKKEKFFDRIVPLPHPRFIMQYRLKKKEEYIDIYLKHLKHSI